MRASPGDRLIVKKTETGEPARDGEILEVHGQDGQPPYIVRWSDDGTSGLVFPGPGAEVQNFSH
jgi:hypothetical protein